MAEYTDKAILKSLMSKYGFRAPDMTINEFVDDECPTADAAPVVHGYWIEVSRIEHDYETEIEEKCSECGRHVYRYDTQPQDNFCPSCGALMNEDKNNG